MPSLVLLTLAVCLYLLSAGTLPGIPPAEQKNVTVSYPPHADTSGVSLYLQPPMASMQVQGGSQTLTIQYTNHMQVAAMLDDLQVHPNNCFALEPIGSPPRRIEPGRTTVSLYRLRFLKDGRGPDDADCRQPQPLALGYAWFPAVSTTLATAPSRLKAAKPEPTKEAKSVTIQPTAGEQTLATTPVTISTLSRRTWERFYHAGGAILIPGVLGILTWWFQAGQRRRDERQKQQDLRLEVWKTVLEGIVDLIKKHYIPISRKLSVLRSEIEGQSPERILLAAIILRRQVKELAEANGGFYFRSKTGESLCRALSNLLWATWYEMTGKDEFLAAVDKLQLTDSILTARKLLNSGPDLQDQIDMVDRLKASVASLQPAANFAAIDRLIELMIRVLNFECDRPLYPEWYEEAPRFDRNNFTIDGFAYAKLKPGRRNGVERTSSPLHPHHPTRMFH